MTFNGKPYLVRQVAHGSPEYSATVALRDAVLRRPLGLVFTQEALDAEKDSWHLACYAGANEETIGCLVLRPLEDGTVQMRQVAVVPHLQRKGVGRSLVRAAEDLAARLGYRRIILHARDTATSFYEQLGYAKIGEPFQEVRISHWTMEKVLHPLPGPG